MSSEQSMIFRELTEQDIQQLYMLLMNLPEEQHRHFKPHPYTIEHLQSLFSPSLDRYYVLIFDGVLVGYSMLRFFKDYDNPMFGVCIHPLYQKRGLGGIMTRRTLDAAKESGCRYVRLHVQTDNPVAFRLYHRLGFRVIQSSKTQYLMEVPL